MTRGESNLLKEKPSFSAPETRKEAVSEKMGIAKFFRRAGCPIGEKAKVGAGESKEYAKSTCRLAFERKQLLKLVLETQSS